MFFLRFIILLTISFVPAALFGATQTITFSNTTKTYGDPAFSPATATSGLPVYYSSNNPSVAIIINGGTQIQIVGAGTAKITASQPGNGSYSAAPNNTKTLTVNKATITANVDPYTREYGDPNPVFTINYSGFVNGEDIDVLDVLPTVSTSAVQSSKAGNYAITLSGGSDVNYKFSFTNGTLTITKAPVTIIADDKTRIYGSSNPTFTLSYVGLKNSDTNSKINTKPTISTPATTSSNVGIYPIILSGGISDSYSITLVNGTLEITKAELKVTVDNKIKSYGDNNPTLTFKYSPFKLNQNASVLNEVPTISTTATKTSDAGIYPIVLTGGDANNYYFTLINGTLTINKKSLKVTAENKTRLYGQPNPALTYVYSGFVLGENASDLIQQPSISTTANITSNVGSYPITLTGGEALNYSFNLVAGTLKITQASQTIDFPEQPVIAFGAPDFSPATASTGLPITYSSSDINIISVVNGKLHTTGVGQVLITAFQAGNINYAPVNTFRWISVGKTNQVVTFPGDITKKYLDEDFNPGATASSGLPVTYTVADPSVAVPSFGGIKIIGAGVTTITATQPGNSSFSPASATVILTVEKTSQAITFPALPPVDYTYTDFTPGATSDSHLDVVYTSDNPSVAVIINNLIHISGTGKANITASQPGNKNYQPADDVTRELTVNKAVQTITFDILQSRNYNDPDFSPDAYSSSGLPILYSSSNPAVATIVNNQIHITGVGSTEISASQPGNTNYQPAGTISRTLQVSKSQQVITFNSIPEQAIDNPVYTLTASASSGLNITYSIDNTDVATINNGVVQIHKTGTANITAKQSGNALYQPAGEVTQKLIVKNSSQTVTFAPLPSKTFGDPDFTISATASSGLQPSFFSDNTNIAVVTNNVVKITGAGTVNIYATQSGNDYYAAATPTPQILTIGKASQNISFQPIQDKVFGELPFIPLATASSGLNIEYSSNSPDVAIVIDGKIYITGVGTAQITAIQGGNKNYLPATTVTRTLTVTKSNQTITFNTLPVKKYGQADFSANAVSSSGLPVTYTSSNSAVATIVNNRIHIVSPGATIITASQAGNENYTPAASKTQVLTIEKASQTIEFAQLPEIRFGASDIQPEATATSGLPVTFSSSNVNVIKLVNGFIQVVGTGSASLIASQNGNQYYNAAPSVSQIVVVNKQNQVIVFDSIPEKTYGDIDFDPAAFASSGLPVTLTIENPNVAVLKNNKIHIVGAGSTKITASQDGNKNYSAAEINVTRLLVVKKALIIVSPDKATRNYLATDPVFTITYSGFVNDESITAIDVLPKVTTTATPSSFPGMYDLTASGAMDNNYNFEYQKGIFLILGTTPLKPAKPEGKTKLCINAGKQEFKTSGAIFASTFKWSITPSNAGELTESGKTATLAFNSKFTGKVAITVKAINNQGVSEPSDTLFVNIMDIPEPPTISTRGSYCSTNNYGDSIKILNSQPLYNYQLVLNGVNQNEILEGNGGVISWSNLYEGNYAIVENVCNTTLAENLKIVKVDPSSVKPQLEVKWNDVIVCRNTGDSIGTYRWFYNGEEIVGQNKQYLWTQKKEGYYSVVTSDISGCLFSSDSIRIEREIQASIYPNPNQGNFRLTFGNQFKGQTLVRISGSNSIPVKTLTFSKETEQVEMDFSLPDLKPGIYFLEVIQKNERVFYEKFIRE